MSNDGEMSVRVGVASILEDANDQMNHGLTANFGIKSLGLPAILDSEIDVSDGEMLRSTLEKAREEVTTGAGEVPTTTLKCIAKRLRPNGKTFVKCSHRAVNGDQFCPLHLQVRNYLNPLISIIFQ